MKRLGHWILATGLAVLGAGIVSTGSAGWKKPYQGAQVIALDTQGVEAIDVGSFDQHELTLSDLPPSIQLNWYNRGQAGVDPQPVTVSREGSSMRLKWSSPLYARLTLNLPSTLRSLSGRHLQIVAQARVGTLRIETLDLTWTGDAQELDIRAWPAEPSEDCANLSGITFNSGRVEVLRISIERGSVKLRDLSQVGRIEVHAGPEVGLQVSRIDDLPRIKLLPFDGVPTEPPPMDANCVARLRLLQ